MHLLKPVIFKLLPHLHTMHYIFINEVPATDSWYNKPFAFTAGEMALNNSVSQASVFYPVHVV
jgi:hypothetical protein